MHFTTLNKIKSFSPCSAGWSKLLAGLGKAHADDEPLAFIRILEINGIQDAVWALRCCDDRHAVLLFAADCAEHVLHIYEAKYPNDNRPRAAIDMLRRYMAGNADGSELRAAADAAYVAAYFAAYAAYAAALAAADAADAAAHSAADAAAHSAALAAADAAYAAAYFAAHAAADAAEKLWQSNRYKEIFG